MDKTYNLVFKPLLSYYKLINSFQPGCFTTGK